MPDVKTNTVSPNFATLTKKQITFVRKLTWEMLKTETPFVVVIPSVIGGLGVIIGIVTGVLLGQLLFSGHTSLPLLIGAVTGAGAGAGVGRRWIHRECQAHFRQVIRSHEAEISRII